VTTIDSHHHFWSYNPEDYAWITDALRVLRRDYLPADLAGEMRAAGVGGVISVQARQTLAETRWLLDLARSHEFVRGVVGWVPLVDAKVGEVLAEFAADKKFRGARHVLQGEPDERYLLRADFNRGIAALTARGLAYDILIYERHLPQTIAFVDLHPNQTFVLDHAAKPRLKDNLLEPWRTHLRELARRPHVYCKLSGLATEADYTRWTEAQLHPYFEAALEAFGPRRLMFGSDWPVCLVALGYPRWLNLVRQWTQALAADEQQSIFSGTAMKAYGLQAAAAP
jgi:L-fuconolactonase